MITRMKLEPWLLVLFAFFSVTPVGAFQEDTHQQLSNAAFAMSQSGHSGPKAKQSRRRRSARAGVRGTPAWR